ncbi:hypothetical protein HZU75_13820 [Chitinibacter fontanus]|uniref:Uncharacterized protein n=1 Tax=Chitinibacter fontanus TaxID=1737446 RepID=A0A7D5VAS9_9NEIS|nr:hypothetical protein [Chitinibacter fontanus]QLI82517.1 hypothetical protein HZU75_13820 [Chitinibacter fontanus]
MTLHTLNLTPHGLGERVMPLAPTLTLRNGQRWVAQHYLRYQHTVESVSALLAQIDFDAHTPLFAGQDEQGVYVQVGLIGRENYDRSNTLRVHKLVYGRKWRIDADTPTSEIIQTAFLAIKKAREHEVRELLTVRSRDGKTSAAFSNHHDLPLLAQQRDQLQAGNHRVATLDVAAAVQHQLASLRFAQRAIELVQVLELSAGRVLIDVQLGAAPLARQLEGDFPEFEQLALCVLLPAARLHELPYALMDALIEHSDRHVDETFRFRGFARFSRSNQIQAIADLSLQTRPYAHDLADVQFEQIFRANNYEVDASRAPALGEGELGRKNRQLINQYENLLGHLPRGYEQTHETKMA